MNELTSKQKEIFAARVATLQRCLNEIDTMSKADFICAFGATLSSLNYHIQSIDGIEKDRDK